MIRSAVVGLAILTATGHADPRKPTPRERAAYGMLTYLAHLDAARPAHPCSPTMDVTWGVAKTDPWDASFVVRCAPFAIGSTGADRKAGTADDLWSDRPLVEPIAACRAGCAKARACKVKSKACDASCARAPAETVFYVDTCTQLAGCTEATDCLDAALANRAGLVTCKVFAEAAAHVAKRPGAVAALTTECERDVLRYPELVCVASSTTVAELALCFLTVNRDNVRALLERNE